MIYGFLLLCGGILGLFAAFPDQFDLPVPVELWWQKYVRIGGTIMASSSAVLDVLWLLYQTPTPQQALGKTYRELLAKTDVMLILWHRKLPDNSRPEISIIGIDAEGDRIVYSSVIPSTGSESFLKTVNLLTNNLKMTACFDPEYKAKLKQGLTIQFNYQSGGWGSQPFLMTPDMCGF
jgi:hypothetical protein